jgi:S1-C subfamily serine protease
LEENGLLELFDTHRRAVVEVRASTQQGPRSCSGFFVGPNGHVLTMAYCLDDADPDGLEVRTSDGTRHGGRRLEMSEGGRFEALALIQIEAETVPYLRLADAPPAVGQLVMTMGFLTAIYGPVQGVAERHIDYEPEDTSSLFGLAGGPVLALTGEVVGVQSAVVKGSVARGLRADRAREFIRAVASRPGL